MGNNYYSGIKYFIRRMEAAFEVLFLSGLYYIIWKYNYRPVAYFHYYGYGKFVLVGVYAILIYILFYFCECFRFGYLKASDSTVAQWIAIFNVNFITFFQLCLISNHMLSPLPIILLTIIDLIVCLFFVYVFTSIYHQMYVPKNMLMIYGNRQAITLKEKMDTRSDKYHVSKLLSCDEEDSVLKKEILNHDAIIINDVSAERRNDILKFCYGNKVRTYIVPKITDIIDRGAEEISLFDTPLLLVRGYGPTLMQLTVKRVIDIILCLIAMIPGAPIMLAVAIAIKLEDHGPVFYKQTRVTKDERRFEILKFRSMIVDAEKAGISIPATDRDPRITKVGRFIRAIRIDELPQIINILKGDMSIVGMDSIIRPNRKSTDRVLLQGWL